MKKRLLDLGLCVIGRHTHGKSKPLRLCAVHSVRSLLIRFSSPQTQS